MAIKKLPGGPNPARQKIMNAQRTAATDNAKSGETAKRLAGLRDETKNAKPNVVKIDSNPKPLSEEKRLERDFHGWASKQSSARKYTPRQKINTNPVRTSGLQGRGGPLGGGRIGGDFQDQVK